MKRWASGAVRVLAPCKINPTLLVIERRGDGFHELDLTYLALDLCDRVELSPVAGQAAALRVAGPFASDDVPKDARNLARRAVTSVLELARSERLCAVGDDFAIELLKNIPSQAGLGGGSCDAAAAALGAATRLGISPDNPGLLTALGEIGSDCAFFLAARDSGHARGRGRGERIEVLPALRANLFVALIAPRVAASTQVVYRSLAEFGDPALRRSRAASVQQAWSAATTLESLRAALVNDLEHAALRAYPELSRWRTLLDEKNCAHFRLAGSGSSFFGFFNDAEQARRTLSTVLESAAGLELAVRGSWVARPANHGARVLVD